MSKYRRHLKLIETDKFLESDPAIKQIKESLREAPIKKISWYKYPYFKLVNWFMYWFGFNGIDHDLSIGFGDLDKKGSQLLFRFLKFIKKIKTDRDFYHFMFIHQEKMNRFLSLGSRVRLYDYLNGRYIIKITR